MLKKEFLLLVDINDADCSTRNKFISALHRFSCANITLEKLIYAFLESLVSGDNKALEDTEFEINRMEEYVLQDKAGSDFNMELLHKKKELSVLRNYYEQLIDIGEALRRTRTRSLSGRICGTLRSLRTRLCVCGRMWTCCETVSFICEMLTRPIWT